MERCTIKYLVQIGEILVVFMILDQLTIHFLSKKEEINRIEKLKATD